jgi:chemotaxis protein methyltransferase CheR
MLNNMDNKIFNAFRNLVYDKAGIALGEKKEALVAARLSKRMHSLNIPTYEAYYEYVNNDTDGLEIIKLLDSISTNVTHFFREHQHFEFIAHHIDKWYLAGQRKFRIWSAGCSSGEEPYTIAMTINETLRGKTSDTRVLATDLSTRILTEATEGIYNERDLEKIPEKYVLNYFEQFTIDNKIHFQIKSNCRSLITFQRLNLTNMPFPMKGPFDFIFCRNVMIYFDNAMRKRLLEEYHRLLKPGGFLLVGHAESLTGMLSGLKSVKPSIYEKH